NCRVFRPRARLIGIADGSPGIRGGIVSPTSIQPVLRLSYRVVKKSAPDNHLTTRPDCSVMITSAGRIGGICNSPSVCIGVVPPTCVQCRVNEDVESAPHESFF